MPRRKKDRGKGALDERRRQILDIATRMFAEKGFRQTDVQDIADEAGVGKGTVYRSFGSKKSLFLATVARGMAELVERVLAGIKPYTDPVKRIEVGLREYFSFFDEHKDLVEIFIQERSEFRGQSKATYFTYRDNNINVLQDTLRKGIRKGIFRKINVRHYAEILADLAYGTVIAHLMKGERSRLVSRTQDVLDVYLHGVQKTRGGDSPR